MCGIIGYIGSGNKVDILTEGLKRLEYRGYDSAGIALCLKNKIRVLKLKGTVNNLINAMVIKTSKQKDILSGIGHTRWATHGKPTNINAHPHLDCSGKIAIVHNGIIENYKIIKEKLIKEGHQFKSETDTEVIVHLIEKYYIKDEKIEDAVRIALSFVKGTYGIAVICINEPDKLIVARNSSPLVIGIGENGNFIASDLPAILSYTNKYIYLEDDEIGIIRSNSYRILNKENQEIKRKIEESHWTISMAEKVGYPHFMLKEIYEQPQSIRNVLMGHIDIENADAHIGGFRNFTQQELSNINRIILIGCGTAWHACLIGELLIEKLARIPCEVEYASEFRYRGPILDKNTLTIAISQSGETLDTLFAVKEAQKHGSRVFGIINVVGSTIARKVNCGLYIHSGPEIGVASTKAFIAQITALALIAIYLGRRRELSFSKGLYYINELQKLPEKIERILQRSAVLKKIAKKYYRHKNALYLGRGFNYPIALEGALKLKEISYIHSEGYPAAEMKHGPIALIDRNMPVIFIAPQDSAYEKIVNNIIEVKTRNGIVIGIATDGDKEIIENLDEVFYIPKTIEEFYPILTVAPLQLLAYDMAVLKELDVDKPRNLAKSVTVE
jgi:glucosamine--fructose-6-phosphate aminotransferase (isomerizing)